MKIHELKLDTKYFEDAKSGKKNFVIRKNDRDYQVGDILKKHAWDSNRKKYARKNPNPEIGWQTIMLEGDGNIVPLTAEYSDSITQKVKEVITAEQLNQGDWDDETLEAMRNINWPNVMEVLVDYFDTDHMPDDYVLMEVKVIKTKRDLFKEIYEKYGIQTTAVFHCDLNQEMTDEQYQKELEAWKKFSKMNWNDLEDDETDDF